MRSLPFCEVSIRPIFSALAWIASAQRISRRPRRVGEIARHLAKAAFAAATASATSVLSPSANSPQTAPVVGLNDGKRVAGRRRMVLAPDPVAIGRHGLGNACLLHRHLKK